MSEFKPQSTKGSLWEAGANMVAGYLITLLTLAVVPSTSHHAIATLFVVLSFLKNFGIRRVFIYFKI